MKELIFAEGLLAPVLNGGKLITIRKFRKEAHTLSKGEAFLGVFRDGLNIVLVATAETEIMTFAELSDGQAREDGFKSARSAFFEMKKYYPDLKKTDTIGLIRFEIPKIEERPSVEYNQHAFGFAFKFPGINR